MQVLLFVASMAVVGVFGWKIACNFLPASFFLACSRLMGWFLKGLVIGSAVVTCAMLAWIVIYIVSQGIGVVNWEYVSTVPFQDGGGILPMIITTVWMVGLSLLIAAPIGICAAIYMNEYAKPGKAIDTISFAIESLAGIPSIIYGLFGMLFFVTMLRMKYSILAGAMTVSIMVLPVIIRTTQEALKTVPRSFREGSLALGATKIRTIVKVVLPCAIPGILCGLLLAIGRIVGESAAIYLTAGMVPKLPQTIMNSGRTLSVHLYLLAKEGISFDKAYAAATVLIILVFIMNMGAGGFAKLLHRRLTGDK